MARTWTMLCKRLLFLFLFAISFTKAFSAVFVVTSNADSGAGTLREALTLAAANGSSTTDFISFSLGDQSVAGRTLTLITQLPYVSSNLVIDGTTQPGPSLGRSDAKITLQPVDPENSAFNGLVLLDADGVQIYGLYIRDFIARLYYSAQQGVPDIAAGIYAETSSNVQIGAPGKGNVFANDGFALTNFGFSLKTQNYGVAYGIKNLKFYSNFVGFEPDGKTYRGSYVWLDGGGIGLNFGGGDIRIGDDDVATRNLFGNGAAITGAATGTTLFQSNILIKNNYFSYDIDGNPTAIVNVNTSDVAAIALFEVNPTEILDYPYTINIINNKFQWPYSIGCGHIKGNFTMQGNTVAFEPSVNHPAYEGSIGASSDANILIGGVNPGEGNSLYGEEIDLFSRKSVLLQRNSIYCVSDFRGIWWPAVPFPEPPLPLPVVNITQATANRVSGTATPLSKVELFFDDDCSYCEPLTYISTVDADANGNWNYDGPIQKGVIASATLNGFTSLFTKHAVYVGGKIAHSSCGQNNGSITGTVFQNTGGYQWKNEKGEIIGTDAELKNLKPGNYTLTAVNSTCSKDYPFVILDATPKINDDFKLIVQPSCGKNTGSVTGLYLDNYDVLSEATNSGDYNVYMYKWLDAGNNAISTTLDLINVPPGVYRLQVSYRDQCAVTYGPVTLKNTVGPSIDLSGYTIQFSGCDTHSGFVKGLKVTGTGTLRYSWTDEQEKEVATTLDLANQPAGFYTLHVSDDSQCDPIVHQFEIQNIVGVETSPGNEKITAATCGEANGSITNFFVVGASNYKWTNAKGEIVGDKVDLTGVGGGDYRLTVSDNCGHSITSDIYHIDQQDKTTYPDYKVSVLNICPGSTNGGISIITDALVKSVRWVNSSGQTVGNAPALPGIGAGTYQLYLTDQNGCESLYKNYIVDQITPLAIEPSSVKLENDHCSSKHGSISNIVVTGGKLPYSYTWTDAGGTMIGTSASLTGLAAGDYTLSVSDATSCNYASASYTVVDETIDIAAPSADNLKVCAPGNAFLIINNTTPGYTYRLYDSETSATPVAETEGGKFNIDVRSNTTFYVSSAVGSCESTRTEVKVTIGISALNIPNAITPNGDGVNDFWNIPGLEATPSAIVQVYTRYGQKVFESRGYYHPFDGTSDGKALPMGAYYYIINLGTSCDILSGNLTIIR